MPQIHGSVLEIYSTGNPYRDSAGHGLEWLVSHTGGLTLKWASQLTAKSLLYSSLIGLTACATTAEIESLRAEVARANAVAARAEASVFSTQRQLAEIKDASDTPPEVTAPSTAPISPPEQPSTPTVAGGYKWGKLQANQAVP